MKNYKIKTLIYLQVIAKYIQFNIVKNIFTLLEVWIMLFIIYSNLKSSDNIDIIIFYELSFYFKMKYVLYSCPGFKF